MSLPSTIKEILQKLADHKTEKVKVAITDMDGILRGKVISYEKFVSIVEKGFGFCDVVFGWDAGDVAYDNASITGWHTGYPDSPATIDTASFRKIPWENDLPFWLPRTGKSGRYSYRTIEWYSESSRAELFEKKSITYLYYKLY